MPASSEQLTLRFAPPAAPEPGVYGVWPHRVRLDVEADDRSVSLRIERLGPTKPSVSRTFRLCLELAPDPSCRVNGQACAPWSLSRGLPMFGGSRLDPFRRALAFGFFGLGAHRARTHVGIQDAMRALYAAARRVAVLAADRCVPAARKLALTFALKTRFFIYRHLVRDSTGRVRELAEQHPGVLSLASAMAARGTDPTRAGAEALLTETIAGRSRRSVYETFFDCWLDAQRAGEGRDLWMAPSRDVPDDAAARQRRFVIRAAAAVTPDLLWRPLPAGVDLADVPIGAQDNATWFRVVRAAESALVEAGHSEKLRNQGCAFASRHAVELREHAGGRARAVARLIRRIADHRVATGRGLGRSAEPGRALARAEAWLNRIDEAVDAAKIGAAPLSVKFPTAPLAGVDRPGLSIRAIDSARELVRESVEMKHCAAGLARAIFDRERSLYAAQVGRERLTVELTRQPGPQGGWRLGQIRGRANIPPTPRSQRAIRAWFRTASAQRTSAARAQLGSSDGDRGERTQDGAQAHRNEKPRAPGAGPHGESPGANVDAPHRAQVRWLFE